MWVCVSESGSEWRVQLSVGTTPPARGGRGPCLCPYHGFFSQVSEEPKVTQVRQVLASEARWAPPESQVGMVSGVGPHHHQPQGRLGRGGQVQLQGQGNTFVSMLASRLSRNCGASCEPLRRGPRVQILGDGPEESDLGPSEPGQLGPACPWQSFLVRISFSHVLRTLA